MEDYLGIGSKLRKDSTSTQKLQTIPMIVKFQNQNQKALPSRSRSRPLLEKLKSRRSQIRQIQLKPNKFMSSESMSCGYKGSRSRCKSQKSFAYQLLEDADVAFENVTMNSAEVQGYNQPKGTNGNNLRRCKNTDN